MVSVSDFGTRGPGSIPGWAPIIHYFFLLLFQLYNAELLSTSNMNYINDKNVHSITLYIELSSKSVGVGGKFCSPERKIVW